MSATDRFRLAAKRRLPGRSGPQFWTGNDYTNDPAKALGFTDQTAADRWLRSHRHLRGLLVVVEVIVPAKEA